MGLTVQYALDSLDFSKELSTCPPLSSIEISHLVSLENKPRGKEKLPGS